MSLKAYTDRHFSNGKTEKKINAEVLYKCVTVNTKQFSFNATRDRAQEL